MRTLPLGQRIQKNSGEDKTVFVYDEQGQLISDGKREFIYLGGLPVAMFSEEKPNEVLNIHSDHLGTPRAVSNASNKILWRMEGDQFGDVEPSIEQVKLPLRHAGQYADDETGLFYNYYRFYDPKTGRYVTSDPLGLYDGLNPYLYAYGNALMYNDPYGLFVPPAIPQGVVDFSAGFGDTISFGATSAIRDWADITSVDYCSDIYGYGEWAGVAHGFMSGGGVGASIKRARNIRIEYNQILAIASKQNFNKHEAWLLRRYLGSRLKSQTDQPFRSFIYLRNKIKYGDKLGPAFNPNSTKSASQMLTQTSGNFNMMMSLPPNGLSAYGAGIAGSATAIKAISFSQGDKCGCS